MNPSDIHNLSSKEIVQSMARMMGSPIEKAMRAELDVRFMQAVTDLSSNVYSLRETMEKVVKSNRGIKAMLVIVVLLLVAMLGLLGYYIYTSGITIDNTVS